MEQIDEGAISQFALAIKGKEKDIDENGSGAKTYKIWGYHETFFINRQGKVVGKTFRVKDCASKSMKDLVHYFFTSLIRLTLHFQM